MLNMHILRIRMFYGNALETRQMQPARCAAIPVPPGQSSGARKRCISSLQVTYHQEIHKPTPRLAPLVPTAYAESSCIPVDQSLEDVYLQEGELEPDQSELDFYPTQPSQLHPISAPATLQPPLLHHPVHHPVHHSVPEKQEPTPPLPCYTAPHSPLYGLEDGLRHKINVEIENFRASVQDVMREQFASQRHPHHIAPHCSDQHNIAVKVYSRRRDMRAVNHLFTHYVAGEPLVNCSQSDNVPSVETSVDSGVCLETTPTVPEATPPGLEEEMSLALVSLQTLAAVISSNLQRAEYTTSL